ncbi:MAG: helix-turn-helix domain-containing protein [Candidatus Dormibacteria bacterium]
MSSGAAVDELVRLDDAAAMLGCSVATLRGWIRRGRLAAVRGPHGAYRVSRDALLGLPPPRRGRPPTVRQLTLWDLQQTWKLLDQRVTDIGRRSMTAVAAHPDAFPVQNRLLKVHRLRLAGRTYGQIARALGISTRHAFRLAQTDVVEKMNQLTPRTVRLTVERRASKNAKAIVDRLRARLRSEGVVSHRPRYHRSNGWPVRADILRPPKPTRLNWIRLKDAGLTEEEVAAVMMVGLTAEELNELFLRSFASV